MEEGGDGVIKRYSEKVDKGGDGIKDTHDPTAIILDFEENRDLGNFSDSHGRIWKNSPDSKAFGKFTRFPGIWGISEISEIPLGI